MRAFLLSAALIALSGAASAHTSYLLPDQFNPATEVSIEAAYASEFFTPSIALPSEMEFLGPDGTRRGFDRVEVTSTITRLQSDLPQMGTYRISTGEKLGRVANMVAVDGQWRALGDGEVAPEGADTTTLQTVTVADTYVSRGTPTRQAVDAPIGRLAIHPITHPNQVLLANGFDVELQFDGAPFPNMPFVLYNRGDVDTDVDQVFVTDAVGRAHVTFSAPGQYVLAVRHRGPAPGTEAAVRSYTSSLTFEVLTALPAYPPEPPAERPRRRRVY